MDFLCFTLSAANFQICSRHRHNGDTLAADLAAGNAANSANAKVIAPLKTSKVPFKELFSAIRVFNSEAS